MPDLPESESPDRLPYDHDKFVDRHEELRFVIDKIRRLATSGLERRVVVFRGAHGSARVGCFRRSSIDCG